jgi:hypothetical protein
LPARRRRLTDPESRRRKLPYFNPKLYVLLVCTHLRT